MTQSSANKHTCGDRFSGRSFVNNKNKRGPKTVPWGTPDRTGTHSEWLPPTTTLWCLWVRKFVIQRWVLFWMPKCFNLINKRLWGTASKALEKSIIMTSVCFRRSRDCAKSWTFNSESVGCCTSVWFWNHVAYLWEWWIYPNVTWC